MTEVKVKKTFKFQGEKYEPGDRVDLPSAAAESAVGKGYAEYGNDFGKERISLKGDISELVEEWFRAKDFGGGGKRTEVEVKKPFKYGGEKFELGDRVELPGAVAESVVEKGYAEYVDGAVSDWPDRGEIRRESGVEEGGTGSMEAPTWENIGNLPDRIPVKFLRRFGDHEEGDVVRCPEEYARGVIKKDVGEVKDGFGSFVRETVFPSGHVERGRRGKVLVKKGSDQPQLRYRGRNLGVSASLWLPLDEALELEEEGRVEIVRGWGEVEHYFKGISNIEASGEALFSQVDRRDVIPRAPPAQIYYVLRRLQEQRWRDRAEPVGNPDKYGDWKRKTEDRIEEVLGESLNTVRKDGGLHASI